MQAMDERDNGAVVVALLALSAIVMLSIVGKMILTICMKPAW